MLRMIIADDEPLVRETISRIIDWNSNGIQSVSSTHLKRNSAEAFPAIRIVFKNKRIRNKACCRCEDCVRFFERTAQHPDQRITPVSYTHLDVYKRQVFISLHAATYSVHDCFFKLRILYKQAGCSFLRSAINRNRPMAFQICFGNHIKSIHIAKLDKPGRIRIMACPYRVKIISLHQTQISDHLFTVKRIPRDWVAIMSIYAFQANRLSVQLHDSCFNANLADSCFLYNIFSRTFHQQGVQSRLFSVPQHRICLLYTSRCV